MKKIFATIAVLALAAFNAFAANEYTAVINDGVVEVTDLSTAYEYKYVLDYSQTGTSTSGNYVTDVHLVIYPDGASIAGEYTLSKIDTYESYVYYDYNGQTRKIIDYTGKPTDLIITANGDGTYTINGALRSKYNTSYYYYYYTDEVFTVVAPDPYKSEPAKSNFTHTAKQIQPYDYRATKGYVEIDLNATNMAYMELAFITDKYDVPAGTYSVSDSGEVGTIQASTGMIDEYTAALSDYVSASWDQYFIVGGSLTVAYESGKMTVNGTVITGHGSEITVSATGEDPFGHDAASLLEFKANSDGTTATFTGVSDVFNESTLEIPETVTIGAKTYTVTAIADQACARLTCIETVILPAGIETIGQAAFSLCTGISAISCSAADVPVAGASSFYKVNPAASVTVPSASVSAYKAASGWKMFGDNIVAE